MTAVLVIGLACSAGALILGAQVYRYARRRHERRRPGYVTDLWRDR